MNYETQLELRRAKNSCAGSFPVYAPLISTIKLDFHEEDFIGVSRSGVALLPRTMGYEPTGVLISAIAYATFSIYGMNLFSDEASELSSDELYSLLNKTPFFHLPEHELREIEIEGEITYSLKKRAVVSSLQLSQQISGYRDFGSEALNAKLQEVLLKSILTEENFAVLDESFKLSSIALADQLSLLWDIQEGMLVKTDDYKSLLGFFRRNYVALEEFALVPTFLKQLIRAARAQSEAALGEVRVEALKLIRSSSLR